MFKVIMSQEIITYLYSLGITLVCVVNIPYYYHLLFAKLASLQTILIWKCHGITPFHFQVSSLRNSKCNPGNPFKFVLVISMMEMECIFL